MTSLTPSRARRILGGWSANFIILVLALTQQIILIPLFLKYWSGDTLSAWLTIFAAGNLVLVGDAGLHGWSLNRFLSFKSRDDCDRRTRRYYGAASRLFTFITALLAMLLLGLFVVITPSHALGFSGEPGFDLAFMIMMLGMVVTLPMNLASSLYRARGLYGRVVGVQAWGTAFGQLGQVVGVIVTGSLLVVVVAYVAGLLAPAAFVLFADARRQFPFIGRSRPRISMRWTVGQFAGAFPFAVMNFAEVGLTYVSVLLIGAFVSDRIAIAQWGLTRTIANLLRGLCTQMTLPLAAELGHDHAIGARASLQGLYARGSVFLILFVSVVTSGTLAFWGDFFAIWTHGAIALISRLGPLGAAIALVSSDVIAQLGILFTIIVVETLDRPLRHTALLVAIVLTVVPLGAGLGALISHRLPGTGIVHFLGECVLWLVAMALLAAPLGRKDVRERLIVMIPR